MRKNSLRTWCSHDKTLEVWRRLKTNLSWKINWEKIERRRRKNVKRQKKKRKFFTLKYLGFSALGAQEWKILTDFLVYFGVKFYAFRRFTAMIIFPWSTRMGIWHSLSFNLSFFKTLSTKFSTKRGESMVSNWFKKLILENISPHLVNYFINNDLSICSIG